MIYLDPRLAELFPPSALDNLDSFLMKYVVATNHEAAKIEFSAIVLECLMRQHKEMVAA